MPPYPYGPAEHYKAADRGLYGGSTIQFGNNISEKNKGKTRRSWHPNIHRKRLWSNALGKFVQVKVQARVLRTIDKVGGLDEYLLGDKPARIKELGLEGWRLRWEVMRTPKVRERIKAERVKLGLPEGGWMGDLQALGARTQDELEDEDRGLNEEIERVGEDIVEDIEAVDGADGRIIDVKGSARSLGGDIEPSLGRFGNVADEGQRNVETEVARGSSRDIRQ